LKYDKNSLNRKEVVHAILALPCIFLFEILDVYVSNSFTLQYV
jgi:hypothetical protein